MNFKSTNFILVGLTLAAVFTFFLFQSSHQPHEVGPNWPEGDKLRLFTTLSFSGSLEVNDQRFVTKLSSGAFDKVVFEACSGQFKKDPKFQGIQIFHTDKETVYQSHPLNLGIKFSLMPVKTLAYQDGRGGITYTFLRSQKALKLLEKQQSGNEPELDSAAPANNGTEVFASSTLPGDPCYPDADQSPDEFKNSIKACISHYCKNIADDAEPALENAQRLERSLREK